MRLCHRDQDDAAFERVLAEGLERCPLDLLTDCVMPRHWHLVVRPKFSELLSRMARRFQSLARQEVIARVEQLISSRGS
jgi:hypothetical protein